MKLNDLGQRVMNWKRKSASERSIYFDVSHLHSEVSEVFEALRDAEKSHNDGTPFREVLNEVTYNDKGHPEGFGIELADVILVATYLAVKVGIDLDKMVEIKQSYNEEKHIKKDFR